MAEAITIKPTSEGANYSLASIGALASLKDIVTEPFPGHQLQRKAFLGEVLKLTGADISFQYFLPGEEIPFLHAHKQHEELYIIVKGEGEFQVDGDVMKIAEGSCIRVAPEGKRTIRNIGNQEILMICLQYLADSFKEGEGAATDGILIDEKVVWK